MKLISSLLVAGILTVSTAVVAKPLYMFITHASVGAASSVFWQAVKNGMEDACELYDADCQMVYLQSEDGNIGEEIANFNAAIAAGALMSTSDTLVNASSSVIINDVYRPLTNNKTPDKRYIHTPYKTNGSCLRCLCCEHSNQI